MTRSAASLRSGTKARNFAVVEVSAAREASATSEPRIEIIKPNGCRILIFNDWTPELAAEFMVLLEASE
jgi:hypothetical protein